MTDQNTKNPHGQGGQQKPNQQQPGATNNRPNQSGFDKNKQQQDKDKGGRSTW